MRHPSRWTARGRALAALFAVYVVLTTLVLVPNTFLQHFDLWVVDQHFGSKHAGWLWWVKIIVGFGQRWIVTYVLQIVFVIACFRARTIRPMIYFVTALIMINSSVGAVKYLIGRIGPFHQPSSTISAHKIFIIGGDIYPSGHVSNAVVMFGVLAVAIPRYRRAFAVLAVAASVGVGLGTIYMRTHWASDVMGGWVAGGIVLLLLPTFMPWAERFTDELTDILRVALHRRPRLYRRCRAALDWGLRVIPADRDYWAGRAERAARRAGRHRAGNAARAAGVEAVVIDGAALDRLGPVPSRPPQPATVEDEFAGWPATDPSGRARQTVDL